MRIVRTAATAGFTPTQLSTEAAVTLESEGEGFRIGKSALTWRGSVPNLDEAGFARIAREAEKELSGVQGSQRHDHWT